MILRDEMHVATRILFVPTFIYTHINKYILSFPFHESFRTINSKVNLIMKIPFFPIWLVHFFFFWNVKWCSVLHCVDGATSSVVTCESVMCAGERWPVEITGQRSRRSTATTKHTTNK